MREVLMVMAALTLLWPAAAAGDNYKAAGSAGQSNTGAPAQAVVGTPEESKGAFKQLSPGNQQIAEALFNSQSVGAGTRQAWSLDRIASTKQTGMGWGQVFQRMQTEGLIQERNLGNLLADSRRPAAHAARQRSTVIVTGGGKVYVAGGGRNAAPESRGRHGERTVGDRDDRGDQRPQVAQRAQKRPQGDGRGWIASGGGRQGSPAYGVATASTAQALSRGIR